MDNAFEYLPLNPGQKTPLAVDWHNRTFSRDAYAKVTSNFGVKATDTICILESDDAAKLAELVGPIPETYTVQARDNRPHYYFLQTEATRAAGNMDVFGVFEFKQNRRYVVAEGSLHPTGAVYTCICHAPVAVMPDELVAKLIKLRQDAPPRSSAASGRHPAILEWCGKNWVEGISDEDFIQGAIDFDAANNNPPRGKRHAAECARWYIDNDKERNGAGPKPILGAPRLSGTPHSSSAFDSVLGAYHDAKLGAFPLGEVSLIQGGSGTGKTTLGVDMLMAQETGREYLGCATFRRSYLVLMLDRSRNALIRTFFAMGLPMNAFPYHVLTPEEEDQNPAVVARKHLETERREIVFIEGLDLWTKTPSDPVVVQTYMRDLVKVAEHFHTAIIGTVGAPKVKVKDGYKNPRDRAIGSTIWSRKAETIVDIVEDSDTNERKVSLMVRSCKPRVITMVFDESSRLVPKPGLTVAAVDESKPTVRELMRLLKIGQKKAGELLESGRWREAVPEWVQ